jgi:hypothetical protein
MPMDEGNHIHCALYRLELVCAPFKDQNQRAAAYWPDEFDENEMNRLFVSHFRDWEVEDITSYIRLFMIEYCLDCSSNVHRSLDNRSLE